MKPFNNLGMNTLTIRNTGGTDHLSFNSVGIPGFQFIQDEIDYDSRTHHTNMDVLESVQPADLQLLDWAEALARPVHVLLSKSDQLKRNEARVLLAQSVATLAARGSVQLFSARAGVGLDEARRTIDAWLNTAA